MERMEKSEQVTTGIMLIVLSPCFLQAGKNLLNRSTDLAIIVSSLFIMVLLSFFIDKDLINIATKILGLFLIPNMVMLMGTWYPEVYNVNISYLYLYYIFSLTSYFFMDKFCKKLMLKVEKFINKKFKTLNEKF